jgi:hypothetical protein
MRALRRSPVARLPCAQHRRHGREGIPSVHRGSDVRKTLACKSFRSVSAITIGTDRPVQMSQSESRRTTQDMTCEPRNLVRADTRITNQPARASHQSHRRFEHGQRARRDQTVDPDSGPLGRPLRGAAAAAAQCTRRPIPRRCYRPGVGWRHSAGSPWVHYALAARPLSSGTPSAALGTTSPATAVALAAA